MMIKVLLTGHPIYEMVMTSVYFQTPVLRYNFDIYLKETFLYEYTKKDLYTRVFNAS